MGSAHNEFDPTVLVAIRIYLCLARCLGILVRELYWRLPVFYVFIRKSSLGWVLACVGISSVIFGFLYGSIFGLEDIVKGLWKAPMDNMEQLLIISIAFGA